MSYPAASGNPAPPGSMESEQNRSSRDKNQLSYTSHGKNVKDNIKRYNRSRSRSSDDYSRSRSRSYSSRSRSYSRSRSRDWHAHNSHDRSRRSRSKGYRSRRSHSRSSLRRHYPYKRRHAQKSSRRYSRSRSRSYSRHHRRSYSRSRSRSLYRYSRSRSGSWSSSSYSDRDSPMHRHRGRKYISTVPKNQEYLRKVYSKQTEVPVQENSFKNDGSFLEMFKKMQEEQQKAAEVKTVESTENSASEIKKTLPIFGKRRGGRMLKTGMVEKLKSPNEIEEEPKDAWSVYMKEVKRYKEACCDDDSKTRPLVK